jgi:hypothetical protein
MKRGMRIRLGTSLIPDVNTIDIIYLGGNANLIDVIWIATESANKTPKFTAPIIRHDQTHINSP